MQINISTRHGHLSDSTQEKIAAKVEKLSRYFERLTAIEVTVDLEHAESPMVEILVNAEHKHDFVASDRSENLMASVEAAVQKVEQQLRRYKSKIQDHRLPGVGQLSSDTQRQREAHESHIEEDEEFSEED